MSLKVHQNIAFLCIYLHKLKNANCSISTVCIFLHALAMLSSGEGGIRTLGTSLRTYDGLANR